MIEEDINLRFPTLKSLTLFHVLIVAKKNVKNGKNNLSKKNSERMNIINANSKSCLSKLNVRCKEIINIIMSMGPQEEGKEKIIAGIVNLVVVHKTRPRPLRITALIRVISIITSKFLKSKLICKPKR